MYNPMNTRNEFRGKSMNMKKFPEIQQNASYNGDNAVF